MSHSKRRRKGSRDKSVETDRDVLTTQEVAAYLRAHPNTIRRWTKKGLLPATKIEHVWRYRRDDVERLWQSQHPT